MSTPNKYFDLHFHPLFKQMLCKWPAVYNDERNISELENDIELKNFILNKLDELFIHIIASQGSVNQLRNGNLVLGIANVVAMEFGIGDSRKGLFGKILNSDLSKPLDLNYFSNVRKGAVSYYRLMLQELWLYRFLHKNNRLKLLSRKKPVSLDEQGILLGLALEGGHNLCRDFISRKGFLETGKEIPGLDDELYADFCRTTDSEDRHTQLLSPSAESLVRLFKALWKEDLDLLYVTLTHLTHIDQRLLANHAFGLKMLKHPAFYPQGFGIEPEGFDFVEAAYDMKVDGKSRPVLIDIKHMSLKSRLDFYKFRKEKNYDLPILATHMGVTGYSVQEWLNAKEHLACDTREGVSVIQLITTPCLAGARGLIKTNYPFNPWSINLMDDDIREILNSEGLIGMSLDIRILGFKRRIEPIFKGRAAEYLSTQEAKFFFNEAKCDAPLLDDMQEDGDELDAEEAFLSGKNVRQPLWLCFNILHILNVGKRMGKMDAWKQIAIGSDFDGLIDPIHLTRNSTLRGELEEALLQWLPAAEKAYEEEHSCGALLPRKDGVLSMNHEPDMNILKILVRGILYENGKAFTSRWLRNFDGKFDKPSTEEIALESIKELEEEAVVK